MSSKEKTHVNDKDGVKRRPPQSNAQDLEQTLQSCSPTPAVQRAKAVPQSLTSRDILQFHQTRGNQAVGGLLNQRAKHPAIQKKASTDLESLNNNPKQGEQFLDASLHRSIGRQGMGNPNGAKAHTDAAHTDAQLDQASPSTPITRALRLPMVQRNKESFELLKKLAKPQTFEGPTVDVQNEIVEALEKEFGKIEEKELVAYNPSCLGGVVLNPENGIDLEALISSAELIDLPPQNLKDPRSRAVGKSSFDLAKAAAVETKIIVNTLATMEAAGQLDYLRQSGLLPNEDWEIVVEIHYYRERNKSQTRLHKDTLGQTLFVNLNYVNAVPIQGPEFIMNPDLGGKTLGKTYLEYMQEKLPPEFIEDVEAVKTNYGEPTEIGMSEIPAHGVVAFVDEAIHHKTPTLEHRKVSGAYIDSALNKKYPDEYQSAKEAYEKYSGQKWTWYSYASYLKNPQQANADEWYTILDKIKDRSVGFDRNELEELLPRTDFLDIEELIEQGGNRDFGQASILYAKRENIAVKKRERPPLKRAMSEKLLEGYEPLVATGPRRFFRTWVRAVKKSK